ncbi:Peptidoglycan-associated lipoprotein [Dyadobacter sp. CECT 9275]|uniref:Peptidoglycan-associated lipoprotein n=1 Tax=Dyadobacter helix TaxID=2822344 RepID=A0A916JE34_9BACT|nr:OmpA family protein [Dyadobacter sp. CECT 9275]CAG5006185.1 Peptidoglycan-associated lipoprotein [Dyadobacter sp. CECT 9275]
MKRVHILLALCLTGSSVAAQIIDPKKTAERKATDRANSRVDQTIDKGFDKVEEGIGSLFKKKPKKEEKTERAADQTSGKAEPSEGLDSEKKPSKDTGTTSASFTSYSKFDFVPGEKVIALEDFGQDAIGDFPAKWNTDGAGEVVKISGKEGQWLKITGEGSFYPEFLGVMDENCTVEFEMGTSEAHQVLARMFFVDSKTYPNILRYGSSNLVELYFDPAGATEVVCRDQAWETKVANKKENSAWITPENPFVKISVWRQKTRLRVYMNETKVWDVPRAFEPNIPYRVLFSTDTRFLDDRELFITNMRVAKGLPDTRSKLLTEGKFVTNGILFDVNSDRIKAESYGVLKEMAQVLKENPAVRVRISGHTDSDGDPKANLVLSQQRALAVKETLSKDFGIDAARMETNGFGEEKPLDNNATAAGKANNRRVEFTKL